MISASLSDGALCRDRNPLIWFPPFRWEDDGYSDSDIRAYTDIAKMVCAICPRREECADAGIDEEFGVWGGTTPEERKKGEAAPVRYTLTKEQALLYLPKKGRNLTADDVRSIRSHLQSIAVKNPMKYKKKA